VSISLSSKLLLFATIIRKLSSPYYCVCAVFLPPSSSQMRLNNAIPSNMEYFIDFHRSRLEHPSQGGNFLASLLRHHGKQLDSWVVAATFLILIPPLDFDQFNHTRSSLRHHGSIYEVRFGPQPLPPTEPSVGHGGNG